MNKFLFILIILLIPIVSFADSFSGVNKTLSGLDTLSKTFIYPKDAKPIKVFYKTKFVQSMTFVEYKALLLSSKFSAEMQKSEKEGRVKILLHDDPWVIQEGKIFSSKMTITWYNEAGKILKTLTIKIKLTHNNETSKNNQVIKIYRDIAAIGFPITTGTTILMIILLIILL